MKTHQKLTMLLIVICYPAVLGKTTSAQDNRAQNSTSKSKFTRKAVGSIQEHSMAGEQMRAQLQTVTEDQPKAQSDLNILRNSQPKIGHEYVAPANLPPSVESTSVSDQASAYTGQLLTVEDLITIAESNNPTLQQASQHINATMGKAIQAGLYPNPTFRYSAEQIGVRDTAGEFHGGLISQRIVRGGKLQLSRAKFLERVKIAEANALAQQFRVCNDVRITFYSSLALQHRIGIQRELVKSAEDSAVTKREAFNMGQANAADIRRSNVFLQKARLELLTVENMQRQSIRNLSALIGSDIEGANLAGELESQPVSTDFQTLLAELWANSPELIAARAKAQSDSYTVRREQAERIIDITIEGGAGYNFEADQTVASAGVSFPIQIFDRNQGTIQQAKADWVRQCAEIERVQGKLRRDLATEYEHYLTSAQHVEQYQRLILPELKETYRLLLESYKANRTDWNEVLLAQSDYFKSRNEYYDWLAKFRKSEVMIDGMMLSGGLMAAQGTTPGGHIDSVAKPR